MGKYEKYVSPMFLRQDEVKRPHRPGTWVFGQEYRFLTEYCKFTPCLVEFIPLMPTDPEKMKAFSSFNTAKDGAEAAKVFRTANVERDGHKGGGHWGQIRHEAEMLWVFLGTDPENPRDLGARVQFNVGLAEDHQVFEFDEPCCIHVPRGLANCGMKILEQHRTILNINVFTQPTKEACYIEHTYYPLPKDDDVQILNGTDRHYVSSDVEKELG